MSENRNLLLAAVLSFGVFTFYSMWRGPIQETTPPAEVAAKPMTEKSVPTTSVVNIIERQKALASSHRVMIENKDLISSINLETGDIDDATLKHYKENTTPESPNVVLLAPHNTQEGYWVRHDLVEMNATQTWQVMAQTPTNIVIATENQSCRIERTFELDDHYMIRMSDKIIAREKTLVCPKWSICRRQVPQSSNMTVHEGGVGVLGGRLQELAYKDMQAQFDHKGGWLGFTDKYWLVAVIPDAQSSYKSSFQSSGNVYTCTTSLPEHTLQPGEAWQHTVRLFVGAKELALLDTYEARIPADRFELAVDFGWFYFITKPLFYALQAINKLCGSLGLAILLMTILSKIVVYPLSRKSYRAMERMKAVAPKMEKIKARYHDDPTRMQQEIWALYKKEKANPLSGCLPQLLQMPLFFCLYKVFSVSLEMRHASFMGWIQDLSMPDPTHLFNLFGLLPFTPPAFLHIGLWPLLMGASMAWQQSLAPPTADPAQARMMWIMPVMFVFLFSGFPAGVVLYWTLSNVLAIAQQLWEKRKAVTQH